MARLGLALSGGGFRATLYHLGVVRFLRDAGLLRDVTDIASVSGGSILAAHLALHWDRYNGDDREFDRAASEIVRFVQFDVRNRIVRRLPLLYVAQVLARLTPWRERNLAAGTFLEGYYRTHLYGDRCLHELPEAPRLHILATNVSNGGLSVFNREGLHIKQRRGAGPAAFEFVPGRMATIAKVVCASSAFPGFFPPVAISADDLGVREGQFPTEWFTDGGVFDNLGIRAFTWLEREDHRFDKILVSDAGKPFQVLTNAALGVIGQSVRATDILWDRVWQLERENFGNRPEFLFVPITATVDPADDSTAQHPVVQPEVQSIRTDLDRFTPVEINALVRHGFEVARKIYREHVPEPARPLPEVPPWAPLPDAEPRHPGRDAPSTAPATALARTLRSSSRRRVLSSLFDPRDWPSYVYAGLLAFVFLYLPYKGYEMYRRAQMHATVIEAISQGEPDIRQLFQLINEEPTLDWNDAKVVEAPEPSEIDNAGVAVMSRSRIVDLRRWHEADGALYVHERLTVHVREIVGDRQTITVRYALPAREAHFRDEDDRVPRTIRHIKAPIRIHGEERTLYEVEYDLTGLSRGEPVTLMVEALIPRAARTRALHDAGLYQFETEVKTDLATVWLLFPTSHPYRTYSLIRIPADRTLPPELMPARFAIDHPYGALIGWSVINPEPGALYECRWTTE